MVEECWQLEEKKAENYYLHNFNIYLPKYYKAAGVAFYNI